MVFHEAKQVIGRNASLLHNLSGKPIPDFDTLGSFADFLQIASFTYRCSRGPDHLGIARLFYGFFAKFSG